MNFLKNRPALMATAHLSTVDTWRGDIRHATLLHNEARKKAEPYAMWERESRVVFVSEVQGMPMEQLRLLADDMQSAVSVMREEISTQKIMLAQCPGDRPMAAQEINQKIHKLIYRKHRYKQVMLEADRCLGGERALLQQGPKAKKKKQSKGPTNQDVNNKMRKLTYKVLFEHLSERLGEKVMQEMHNEAAKVAIKLFMEWGEQNQIDEQLIDRIVLNEIHSRGLATK